MIERLWDSKKGLDIVDVGFLLVTLGFVAFKAQFLDLPLYWDEAWVYAPAVRALANSGLNIMPDALDTYLSRGHPLLFHNLASIWASMFGSSNWSLHAFALTTSVVLIALTYWVGLRMVSKPVGFFAALWLILNEKFLAQSGILLPEVLLSIFLIAGLYGYQRNKPWVYALFTTAALFTKESALVLVVAVLVWHIVRIVLDHIQGKPIAWNWLLYALIPIAFIGSFFVYQHHLFGWYLFPEHTGMVSFNMNMAKAKFKLSYGDVFEIQGLSLLTILVGVVLPISQTGKALNKWQGVLSALLLVLAVKVLYGKWPVPDLWKLPVAFVALTLVLFTWFIPFARKEKELGNLISLFWVFSLGFLLFSSLNFFTNRYLVCLIPIAAIGMGGLLEQRARQFSRYLFPACGLIISIVLFTRIGDHNRVGDCELRYAQAISVHQKLATYCTSKSLENERIYVSFVEQCYLSDAAAGYVNPEDRLLGLSTSLTGDRSYAIFTSDIPDQERDAMNDKGFELIERIEEGMMWAEVYQRKSNRN